MTKKWKVKLENQETGKKVTRTIETQGERSGFPEVRSEVVRKLKAKNTVGRWDTTDITRVE